MMWQYSCAVLLTVVHGDDTDTTALLQSHVSAATDETDQKLVASDLMTDVIQAETLALDMARMANAAYDDKSEDHSILNRHGWTRVARTVASAKGFIYGSYSDDPFSLYAKVKTECYWYTDTIKKCDKKTYNECAFVAAGTNDLVDWFSNGWAKGKNYCGHLMHSGFANEFQDLLEHDDFKTQWLPVLRKCKTIHYVGHSLGGAIASIAAHCAKNGHLEFGKDRPGGLYTIGAPGVSYKGQLSGPDGKCFSGYRLYTHNPARKTMDVVPFSGNYFTTKLYKKQEDHLMHPKVAAGRLSGGAPNDTTSITAHELVYACDSTEAASYPDLSSNPDFSLVKFVQSELQHSQVLKWHSSETYVYELNQILENLKKGDNEVYEEERPI